MKAQILGMMALLAFASIASARPADYASYYTAGASIRYVGPMDAGYSAFTLRQPMGGLDDYEQRNAVLYDVGGGELRECPRTNGVPICGAS